jgi:hypothetical protein
MFGCRDALRCCGYACCWIRMECPSGLPRNFVRVAAIERSQNLRPRKVNPMACSESCALEAQSGRPPDHIQTFFNLDTSTSVCLLEQGISTENYGSVAANQQC